MDQIGQSIPQSLCLIVKLIAVFQMGIVICISIIQRYYPFTVSSKGYHIKIFIPLFYLGMLLVRILKALQSTEMKVLEF